MPEPTDAPPSFCNQAPGRILYLGVENPDVISTAPGTTFHEIEEILLANNIGHLPILEHGKILGIITRSDCLAFRKAEKEKVQALTGSLV